MNRRISKYVNFLIDNNPSPFCDYILCKEILKCDEKTVQDSYEWAKRFKLYNELSDEQLSDGSWGGFDTRNTVQSKGRHYKTTAQACQRMVDLGLDRNDLMVKRTIELCNHYLAGEIPLPDTYGKNNDAAPVIIKRSIIRWLSHFDPDNNYVVKHRHATAERLTKACEGGYFDNELWDNTAKRQEINSKRRMTCS